LEGLTLVGERFAGSIPGILFVINLTNAPVTHDNLRWGDAKRDEIKANVATGTLPLLKTPHGDLSESNAIIQYIVETYKPELLGKDAWQRAQVKQWVEFGSQEIIRSAKALIYPLFGRGEADQATVVASNKDLSEQLKLLNKHLEGKKFVVGDSLTVADTHLFGVLRFFFSLVIAEQQRKQLFGNITTWFQSIASLPEATKAYGRTLLCKVPLKAPRVEKKEEPKKEEKKEEPKKEKKEEGEDDDEEDKPKTKKKNPLESLPPTTFVFDDFKKAFLNTTDRVGVLKDFWTKIDLNGFSFWHMQYQKLPTEGKLLFKSNNSASIFLQNLDPVGFRKWTFSVHGVYGEEGNYEIRGLWLWRGTEIPEEIKEHQNYEYMAIVKLDPSKESDKQLIEDYWLHITPGEVVDGMPVAEVVYFK